ncbi:MAG TPA: NAD-dependent epimerase [Stellaceae bacterium]|nr:NAD-dependent epimerase [Stellaceae bacterium]
MEEQHSTTNHSRGSAAVLITGVAGFIGYHLAEKFLREGRAVVGIDNLSDYYDVTLKRARLENLAGRAGFAFSHIDIADQVALEAVFAAHRCETVINLAAQAGVRYSLTHPQTYIRSNLEGFANLLEMCRNYEVQHLLYASSSSVYGALTSVPFSEHHSVDHPISLYAATKKSNELMAHCYSHLFRLPTTGMRFFTAYGPWGRPDMALFLFTRAILAGEPIRVFNYGRMERDFTYIDDVVEGVYRLADHIPKPDPAWRGDAPDPATSLAPYCVYNIGNNRPVQLMHLIGVLEACLGRTAVKEFLPMQPGDVPATCADVRDLEAAVGFKPSTPIEAGVERFVRWYRDYYGPEGAY